MADRFKFAEVRQEVIEMLKKDLLGPSSENETLNQNPRFEYIVGMLAPQNSENDSNEQEVDGDASFEGDADYTAGEDDDNEPVFTNRFKTPSSIGISFYLESSTKSFNVDVTWGDYTKASDKTTNKEGKKVDVARIHVIRRKRQLLLICKSLVRPKNILWSVIQMLFYIFLKSASSRGIPW